MLRCSVGSQSCQKGFHQHLYLATFSLGTSLQLVSFSRFEKGGCRLALGEASSVPEAEKHQGESPRESGVVIYLVSQAGLPSGRFPSH